MYHLGPITTTFFIYLQHQKSTFFFPPTLTYTQNTVIPKGNRETPLEPVVSRLSVSSVERNNHHDRRERIV